MEYSRSVKTMQVDYENKIEALKVERTGLIYEFRRQKKFCLLILVTIIRWEKSNGNISKTWKWI